MEPAPWYKQGKYVFGLAALVMGSGLLVYGYITDAQWLQFAGQIVSAVLGGQQ